MTGTLLVIFFIRRKTSKPSSLGIIQSSKTTSKYSCFSSKIFSPDIPSAAEVIPYFGPFIGAVPSALLIFISSPRNCLIFLIFILVLQQFDGNVLGPKLLAGSVGLTGFWVLFAITLFQGLFGFVGILVGVPVFAVIYDLARRAILSGLKKHGKLDVLE